MLCYCITVILDAGYTNNCCYFLVAVVMQINASFKCCFNFTIFNHTGVRTYSYKMLKSRFGILEGIWKRLLFQEYSGRFHLVVRSQCCRSFWNHNSSSVELSSLANGVVPTWWWRTTCTPVGRRVVSLVGCIEADRKQHTNNEYSNCNPENLAFPRQLFNVL